MLRTQQQHMYVGRHVQLRRRLEGTVQFDDERVVHHRKNVSLALRGRDIGLRGFNVRFFQHLQRVHLVTTFIDSVVDSWTG